MVLKRRGNAALPASDHDWTTWANNTEMKGRFAAFFALLAGLVFMPFAATVRDTLGSAEVDDKAPDRFVQIAYAGGLIGITSFAIATVTFSGASAEGAQADPSSAERSRPAQWGHSSSRRWASPRSSAQADW